MRRVLVALATVLCLFVTACGETTVTAGGELLLAEIEPAPTVAGNIVVPDQPAEFIAAPVLVGIGADTTIEVRALPGLDQPVAGEIPPGGQFDLTGEAFETTDGIVWWQLRAGTVQGWVQPQVVYSGPATDITGDVLAMVGDTDPFDTPEEVTDLVAQAFATSVGANQSSVVAKTSIAEQYSSSTTIDVHGFEDDSLFGYRLIIASNGRSRDGVNQWTISSVTQLLLCTRGATPEGTCL